MFKTRPPGSDGLDAHRGAALRTAVPVHLSRRKTIGGMHIRHCVNVRPLHRESRLNRTRCSSAVFPTGEDRLVPEIVRAMTPRFAAPPFAEKAKAASPSGTKISVLTVAASLWRGAVVRCGSKALEISPSPKRRHCVVHRAVPV